MVFDEVQAGFGRTGTFWGFEHYGVVPDLFACGKGISSSLPISAIIGRPEIMNLYGPGSMTSTHTGNPICCAAALANIEIILEEDLVGNAARVGAVMHRELGRLKEKYADRIAAAHGKGLVAALQLVKPATGEPDADLAWEAVRRCIEKGVLLFAPVGFGGAALKIAPPLCITEEAICEAVAVIGEAIDETLSGKG
jgi:4-aminobutyrate aminotransferase-like enzyme